MGFPLDFHFNTPWVGVFFLGVLGSIFLFLRAKRRWAIGVTLFHFHGRSPLCTYLRWGFLTLSFILVVTALMDPLGYGRYQMKQGGGAKIFRPAPILFLIDTSLSMGVLDGPRGKSRFEEAKDVIRSLLPSLKGVPVGLSTFSVHLDEVSPITYDPFYLTLLLNTLSLKGEEGGSNFLTTFSELEKKIGAQGFKGKRQIVLLSDGEDTTKESINDLEKVIKKLKKEGSTIYSIGIGTTKGGVIPNVTYKGRTMISSLNEELLILISQLGGGKYMDIRRFSARDLASRLEDKLLSSPNIEMEHSFELIKFTSLYQFPLLLALLLTGIAFLLPQTNRDTLD
ncbi:VWA domain-containing protein [Chlamydiales bacterium]|nr:VWA domain-containing protein [Chlamydiales bacterium]